MAFFRISEFRRMVPQREPNQWAVRISAPMGRLIWQQLERAALLAHDRGEGTIRISPDQNVVSPGVSAETRSALGFSLAWLGLEFEADSLSRQIAVCTGNQFCSLALTEAKGYGLGMLEELRRRQLELYGIRIARSKLSPRFRELAYLRPSQLNACHY